MSTEANQDSNPVFIKRRAVQNFFGGVSAMWIERRLGGDPLFPKPVYISRERFWRLDQLEQYMAMRAAEPPPPKPGIARSA